MPTRAALTVAVMILTCVAVLSKPMPTPDPREARARSIAIVEAKFVGRMSGAEVTYFGGAVAKYRVERVLAGAVPRPDILVHYAFQDGSACIELEGWRFSESMMPRSGSHWILFLLQPAARIYPTYRGDYGRWPASPDNLSTVRALLTR